MRNLIAASNGKALLYGLRSCLCVLSHLLHLADVQPGFFSERISPIFVDKEIASAVSTVHVGFLGTVRVSPSYGYELANSRD
jgi:hypothetical protein